MRSRLRPFGWPLLLIALAITAYSVRIHEDMVDFEVYRTAAGRAMDAENLYRPSDWHYQFKYLPAFAFAMAPFAMVEPWVARLVWYALSFSLLCTFVRWCARSVPQKRLSDVTLMCLAALFLGKYFGRDLLLGQTNILLGTVLVAALLAAEAGAQRTAGVLVAIGVFVKPYAVILVPWLWLVAGVPGLLAGGVALAIGLLLPAFAYGWQGNIDQLLAWFRTVSDTSAPNLLIRENISFASAWAKWIGPGQTSTVLTAATGAFALWLSAVIVLKRRGIREPAYLELGAFLLLVPLLSPQGWDYVLLLATPAILVLVDRWREMTPGWRTLTALGLGFSILDLLGLASYDFALRTDLVTACALVLLACLVNVRLRKLA